MADGALEKIDLAPRVVLDEALIETIQERAHQERKQLGRFILSWTMVGGVLGLVMMIAQLPYFSVLGALILISMMIGHFLSTRVESDFRKRHYNRVHRNLPAAIRWNALWTPFTYISLNQSASVYLRLLLAEERALELEAISYFGWAYSEGRKSVKSGMPKNFGFLNNIAVALIQQEQYEDALLYFEAALETNKGKKHRGLLMNNYTLCLIKVKRLDEAATHLQELQKLNGGNIQTPLGVRFKLLKALYAGAREDWTEMETLANESLACVEKANESAEFRAGLLDIIGVAQFKMQRFEEAELNIRSAIELFQSGPNPPYRRLASVHANYAELLTATGKSAAAADQIARAEECLEAADRDAQEDLSAIRARLANPRRLANATELAASSRRPLAQPLIAHKD